MSEDNNVVQFPIDKVKRPKSPTSPETSGLNLPMKQSRSTVIFSMLFTLVVATLVTNQLNDKRERVLYGQKSGIDRTIASQSELGDEIELARKLAVASLRGPASGGRQPTAEDILRHGELAGMYAFGFKDGAITSIKFSEAPGNEPKLISFRDQFLVKYRDLLRVDFEDVLRVGSYKDKGRIFEVYTLRGRGQELAKVHFTIGDRDELYEMKVESLDDTTESK